MEDNLTRAITIGVTIFLLIIVITAISMYYNTAVEQAQAFKNRVNYGTIYTKELSEIDNTVITGTEARSIIRKYATEYNNISIYTFKMEDTNHDGIDEEIEQYTTVGVVNVKDEVGIKEDVLIKAADLSKKYLVTFTETSNTLFVNLEEKE